MVLGAANLYLGLRVGLTVSASIPAAVIAMAVLRLFRKSNILEYNAVQTAASAGESLAAGVLFTIPALLLLNYWESVDYVQTAFIALIGGLLGILFTVPIRRALIVEGDLTFPEGVATSEVLKAGEGTGDRAAIGALIVGAVSGVVYKALEAGFGWFKGAADYAYRLGDKSIGAIGIALSPALIAVGYIVHLRIAALVFFGGALGWLIGIPLYTEFAEDAFDIEQSVYEADPEASLYDLGLAFWSARIRYMGVGAMLVGGLWSLLKLRKPLGEALTKGFKGGNDGKEILRTEQEISGRATWLGVVGMTIPMGFLYWYVTESILVAVIMSIVMLVAGFVFSALGGYLAGLVGSSNNPISGVTIITVIFAALSLKVLGVADDVGAAATIMVAAIIACAAAIASDNIQDLKAGHILGATPKKQQMMQIVGVSAAAIPLGFVLQLLHDAYTIGSTDLAAPQASLMASVAGAFFGGEPLPNQMLIVGAGIAVALIVLDEILASLKSNFRAPVMPVAVGIYLPIELSTPIFIGGLIAWFVGNRYKNGNEEQAARGKRAGVLFSSGLIAGEALMGIAIAAPVAYFGSRDEPLPTDLALPIVWPGLLLLGFICFLLYYVCMRPRVVE